MREIVARRNLTSLVDIDSAGTASYHAGDTPVHQWIAVGDYKDVPEWVESIPYSETRDYVQAIMRNREMYRAVYAGR